MKIGAAYKPIKQLDSSLTLTDSDKLTVLQDSANDNERSTSLAELSTYINTPLGEFIRVDGSTPFTGNQSFGGNTVTDVASLNGAVITSSSTTKVFLNGTGAYSSIPTPENVVQVYSMDDFPVAVSGVRTLEANTQYNINASLTTSDRFVIPGGSINSFAFAAFNITELTYSGTGIFISGVGIGAFQIFDGSIISSSTGSALDISGIGLGLSQVAIIQSRFNNWSSIGAITSANYIETFSAHINSGGITLTDCPDSRIIEFIGSNPVDLASTYFTITGTSNITTRFQNASFTMNPNETAYNLSSSIGASSKISILGTTLSDDGTVFDAGGLDQKDLRVNYISDSRQKNSDNIGSFCVQENATETFINTQGVYEDFNFNGSAVTSNLQERWGPADATTGAMEYLGLTPIDARLTATITGEIASGNILFGVKAQINRNDGMGYVDLEDPTVTRIELKNRIRSATYLNIEKFDTGDLLKFVVTNLEGTQNATFTDFCLVASIK